MHIVIIDDEKILSHGIKKRLTDQDFSVSMIHSVSEYKSAKLPRVDLYLIDITLGDGTGFEIIKDIREDEKQKNTPILIISGHNDIKHKLDGFDIGADDYLVKPFNPKELVVRVRKRIQDKKYHSHVATLIEYKDISFNRQERAAYKNGESIILSKKEKNLLEHFIVRVGELVTKDELAESFWNNDNPYSIIDNTINVTICNLRKKLGEDFQLETVPGEGYILKKSIPHL